MSKTPSGSGFKRGGKPSQGQNSKSKQYGKRVGGEKTLIHKKREKMNIKGVLLWGTHAVKEALMNGHRTCYRLWVTESGHKIVADTLANMKEHMIRVPELHMVSRSDIDHFLPADTVHQGIALEAEPLIPHTLDDMLDSDFCPDVVVILDQVTDPHNVGAVLRSASAFGAGAIIVPERGAPSINGVMAKIASGAAEHVPLITVKNLARAIEELQQERFHCVGLAEEGEVDISKAKLGEGRVAIVLGAEGEGMRQLTRQKCDQIVRLPTQPPIGSLNVSNAAAISLYEVKRQRG